jgi:acyl carrier protein
MESTHYETVERILVDTFGVSEDQVGPDATFESLDLDSLDVVELTLAVEEETGVAIEDEELEGVRTVADAVKLIDEKAKVQA